MGTALAITAFPMLARILQEKGIIDTRIGALSMLSASLQDVVSWILLGVVTAIATGGSVSNAFTMFFGAVALVLVLFYIARPLLRRWVEAKTNGEQLDPALFSTVLFLLIACAVYTDHIGLYSVFGGFMLGLAMPRNEIFLQQLSVRLKDITLVLLLPVFFAYSGLNTDLTKLATSALVLPALAVIFLAFASKLAPLFVTMRLSGYSVSDSAAIASLMNSRGLMELIIANIGLFYGLIDLPLFSILVLVAITTTLAAMPLYELSQRLGANQKARLNVFFRK